MSDLTEKLFRIAFINIFTELKKSKTKEGTNVTSSQNNNKREKL